jgi:hypothetical protein
VVVRRRKRRTTDADRAVEAVPEQNEQVVIEPLTKADVAAAVKLAVPVLRVRPGDRAEQFAAAGADSPGWYRLPRPVAQQALRGP